MIKTEKKILLGSKSPRRKELLTKLDLKFELVDINYEEVISESMEIDEVAMLLAKEKNYAYGGLESENILITADTIVVHQNQIYGKPNDRDEAISMLKALSNSEHSVITGVCLRSSEKELLFQETTKVFFDDLSDEIIEYYIDNYRPYDKAGSYGIQEWIGMTGISGIEGDYFNVVGLPVHRLYSALLEIID